MGFSPWGHKELDRLSTYYISYVYTMKYIYIYIYIVYIQLSPVVAASITRVRYQNQEADTSIVCRVDLLSISFTSLARTDLHVHV